MGSIRIQPTGNRWLFRSAIAKMSKLVSTEDLKHVFNMKGAQKVQIKAIGGRHVVILFPDKAIRDSIIKEKWLTNWFEDIKPWEGEQANEERFVWLSCYGMPLNAWAYPTFRDIGNKWGHFLQVDESTLKGFSFVNAKILIATNQFDKIEGSIDLVVDEVNYSVSVREEGSFRFIKHSLYDVSSDIAIKKIGRNDEDDDREINKVIVENVESKYGGQDGLCNNDEMVNLKDNLVVEDELIKSINMAAEALESRSPSLGIETSIVGNEIVADSMGIYSNDSQSQINTPNGLESQEAYKEDCRFVADSEEEECNDNRDNWEDPTGNLTLLYCPA